MKEIVEEPSVALICTKEYSNINKITEHDHLTDESWHEWRERMKQVFINCEITGYTDGTVKHPDISIDSHGAHNWDRNDTWVQQIIIHNVTSSQMNHVGSKTLAEAMYSALSMTHKSKVHQTVNHIQCLLYETKAITGTDILKHMDTLKSHRDLINQFPNPEFHILDTRFKSIILASLPSSWQHFVEPYNGNVNDPNDPDPKCQLTLDTFIGLLCEEYQLQINRDQNRENRGTSESAKPIAHVFPINPLRIESPSGTILLNHIVITVHAPDIGHQNAIRMM
jgi:hypothetical protein